MKETTGFWSKFTCSASSVIPYIILYLAAQTWCPMSSSVTYREQHYCLLLSHSLSFYLAVQWQWWGQHVTHGLHSTYGNIKWLQKPDLWEQPQYEPDL